jgi:hypothetical protein
MSSSSIPRAKAALFDLLSAAAWPAPAPTVSYGWARDIDREVVMIGGTVDEEQTWASFGPRRRDETYRLKFVVQVTRPGLSQRQATERAFELLAVIEDTLRTTPDLGLGIELTVAELADPRLREGPDTEGYAAVIEAGVAIRARI